MTARAGAAVRLRDARPDDVEELSALARRSKAHWGYSEALLELWRDDLTFTATSIAEETVTVAERGGAIVGVVSVSFEDETAEVEALWIDPTSMGAGIGRALFERAVASARERGATRLVIDTDPNAEGFYLRQGAQRIGRVPAKPEGRTLPRLVMSLVSSFGG